MRGILEAMHDYPDEALGLCFFFDSGYLVIVRYIREKR